MQAVAFLSLGRIGSVFVEWVRRNEKPPLCAVVEALAALGYVIHPILSLTYVAIVPSAGLKLAGFFSTHMGAVVFD